MANNPSLEEQQAAHREFMQTHLDKVGFLLNEIAAWAPDLLNDYPSSRFYSVKLLQLIGLETVLSHRSIVGWPYSPPYRGSFLPHVTAYQGSFWVYKDYDLDLFLKCVLREFVRESYVLGSQSAITSGGIHAKYRLDGEHHRLTLRFNTDNAPVVDLRLADRLMWTWHCSEQCLCLVSHQVISSSLELAACYAPEAIARFSVPDYGLASSESRFYPPGFGATFKLSPKDFFQNALELL